MPTVISSTGPNAPQETSPLELVHSDGSIHRIDRDTLRIGSSEICEIQLDHGPSLHSMIHNEDGVVWIEAEVESHDLLINGRNCRRMALRDGDGIMIGLTQMMVRHRTPIAFEDTDSGMQDISEMSASELCDRIEAEQAAVDSYESAMQNGLQRLMSAVRATHDMTRNHDDSEMTGAATQESKECERLLDQIRELSDLMNGRTVELDECEAELVAATELLHETQDRISQQIEELFDQFSDLPLPKELRASA